MQSSCVMLRALATSGPEALVSEVMRADPKVLHPSDNLDDAFGLVMGDGEALPVVDGDGRLVGLLTSDSVGEFLLVREALKVRHERGGRSQLPAARMLELPHSGVKALPKPGNDEPTGERLG